MALTVKQRIRTSLDLNANFELSGLSKEDLSKELDLGLDRIQFALDMAPETDPAEVWLIRDYLQQEIEAQGLEPRPYSVITEEMRFEASTWFKLRAVPPTKRTASVQ